MIHMNERAIFPEAKGKISRDSILSEQSPGKEAMARPISIRTNCYSAVLGNAAASRSAVCMTLNGSTIPQPRGTNNAASSREHGLLEYAASQ